MLFCFRGVCGSGRVCMLVRPRRHTLFCVLLRASACCGVSGARSEEYFVSVPLEVSSRLLDMDVD